MVPILQDLEERLKALDEENERLRGSLETVTAELDSSREKPGVAEEAAFSTGAELAAVRQQVEAGEAECCALNDKIRWCKHSRLRLRAAAASEAESSSCCRQVLSLLMFP